MKNFNILYVLPVSGGSGGAHSVAQEVNELIKFGINVHIAVNEANVPSFKTNYSDLPNISNCIVSYRDDEGVDDLLEGVSLVVCTYFKSVRVVKEAIKKIKSDKPRVAYYIQDYEPMFCMPDDDDYPIAMSSYTEIDNALLFAKTDWIRNVVSLNHHVDVKKVSPSIDTGIYYPSPKFGTGKIQITAMIRPSTTRRAPLKTMTVLKELAERYGDKVSINIFGSSDHDIYYHQLPSDFHHINHGVLSRLQVSALLRESTLFLDLSDYQAFGRTGLEAMACGCVAVLPVFGGADEYVIHEENSYFADTRSLDDILRTVGEFIGLSDEERLRMSDAAIAKAQEYSIGRAAHSKMKIFRDFMAA